MRYKSLVKHCATLFLSAGLCAVAHAEALPTDYIKWETVPSAIRSDGLENFTIQVHAPGAKTVTIKPISGATQYITPAPGYLGITLKDDGVGADKVAGDKIFTAGPFKYDTAKAFPVYFGNDSKSPAGVYMNVIGSLQITFNDTVNYPTYNSEGKDPAVGLLRKDIAATPVTALNANISKASHMVAVKSDRFDADRYMRYNAGAGDSAALTKSLYAVLPDAFDQILLYSTYLLQGVRSTNRGENGISGIHYMVKNEVKGIGQGASDWTASYGSAGRLQAVNAFWSYGLQGPLVNHEITHTWEAFLYHSNQLQSGGHWYANNSLGMTWKDNGNGTFTLSCNEPMLKASPMTLYLMGAGPSSAVPHVRSLNNNEQFGPGYECSKQITKPFSTISINDLIALNGVREPAYGVAPKNFSLLFAVQSYNRSLNATEMTFFNTLAKHLAVADTTVSTVSPTSWRPLSSWFTGTTWQTAVSGGGGTSDTTPPVITLNGSATMSVAKNSTFTDPGATAQDNVDGNISAAIVKTGSVNTAVAGSYVLRYNVRDAAGNAAAEVTRTVTVTSTAVACVSATNYQHVGAGRAFQQTVNFVTNAYAKGSNNNLGSYGSAFYSPTTILKETSPGYWIKVTSCS
jgi:hypothetical protein